MPVEVVIALLDGLPSNSAISRAIYPSTVNWSVSNELQALNIEMIDRLTRQMIALNTDKSGPRPIRIPRPGARSEGTSLAEFKQMHKEAPARTVINKKAG